MLNNPLLLVCLARLGAAERERSSTDAATGRTSKREHQPKKEAVLHLMRGEPADAVSRELGVEIYRLEEWRERFCRASKPPS